MTAINARPAGAVIERVLVAGDTHGNVEHFQYLADQAVNHGCQAIVQVGDWGYTWPGREHERVAAVQGMLRRAGLTLFWLDGNHDNFTHLDYIGALDADEPVVIADDITYLPRGCVWEWSGVRFMSLGGAVSIDKARRIPGLSWWPEETLTLAQVEKAKARGPVDVMLCHDAPSGVRSLQRYLNRMTEEFRVPYKIDEASEANRALVREVADAVRPALLIHGHYHHRYWSPAPWDREHAKVLGLDRDTTNERSIFVLDMAGFLRDSGRAETPPKSDENGRTGGAS